MQSIAKFYQLCFQNILRIQLHFTIPTWALVQATISLHWDYSNRLLPGLSAVASQPVLSAATQVLLLKVSQKVSLLVSKPSIGFLCQVGKNPSSSEPSSSNILTLLPLQPHWSPRCSWNLPGMLWPQNLFSVSEFIAPRYPHGPLPCSFRSLPKTYLCNCKSP